MPNILVEDLKTIRNLCDIALLLISGEHINLLPTTLELMLIEVQSVVEEHCVKENQDA